MAVIGVTLNVPSASGLFVPRTTIWLFSFRPWGPLQVTRTKGVPSAMIEVIGSGTPYSTVTPSVCAVGMTPSRA